MDDVQNWDFDEAARRYSFYYSPKWKQLLKRRINQIDKNVKKKVTGEKFKVNKWTLRNQTNFCILSKHNTDTKIVQTKTTIQESLEFKLTKSKVTCSMNQPKELNEEKYMLAVTNLEVGFL